MKKILKFILTTSLILTFLTSESQARDVTDTTAKTVKNAISENHNVIEKIAKKIGIKNPNLQPNIDSINEYMQIVAYFESKLNKSAYNSSSGASGYFQFLNSSFKETRNYIIKNKDLDYNFPTDPSIYGYSYQGQSQLAMTLWYNHSRWSSKNYKNELKGLFTRDYNSGIKVYCSYHHTKCSRDLSGPRNKALKTALKNWSKNKYFIGDNNRYPGIKNDSDEVSKSIKENIKKIKLKLKNIEDKKKILIIKGMISELNKMIQEINDKKEKNKSDILTPDKIKKVDINKIIDKKEKLKKEINQKNIAIKKINKKNNNIKTINCPDLIDHNISKVKYTKYDITDLKTFLNKYEKEKLKMDGKLTNKDIEAIKRFQLKYKKDILEPLEIKSPTGEVFEKTRAKINSLYCEYKKSGNGIKVY